MKIELLHKGVLIETKDLTEGNHKIGRNPDCAIQIKSPQVSKQHALLVIKGNKAAILDMGSSNGVFVNGILIKKQRIAIGDEVVISDYLLRIANPFAAEKAKVRKGGKRFPATEGNLARQLDYSDEGDPAAQVPPTPQEKLLFLIDQKVLAPFYGLFKQFDWRWVLASIIGISLVCAVLLSVIPIVRWGKEISTQESINRAHTIVAQTVRENTRILTKTNDFTRTTVEAIEGERGVLGAYIIDPKSNTVLAPTKYLNRPVTDVYYLIALKKVLERKDELVSIEKDDGTYVIAQPITLFSQEDNERSIQAVVLIDFEIPARVYSTYEPLVEAILFAILMSLIAYFLIFKMFTYPILTMQEQLDAALKGEDITVTAEAKSAELEGLATVINFSLSRARQAGGGLGEPVATADPEIEDKAFVRSCEEYDQGSSDGILVVDKDKKVAFVGRILDELIGLRNQYAVGQNISDAHRDPSFTGTVIDMSDRVIQSLGETQVSQLDLNGTSRTFVAIAHRNSAAEIRFVLIVIKLGGGS